MARKTRSFISCNTITTRSLEQVGDTADHRFQVVTSHPGASAGSVHTISRAPMACSRQRRAGLIRAGRTMLTREEAYAAAKRASRWFNVAVYRYDGNTCTLVATSPAY